MIVALSSKAMRLADELAITRARIPSIELMEEAGKGILQVLDDVLTSLNGKRVAVVCGSGNNGGDGFVVARLLVEHGSIVHVVTVGNAVKTQDAATNFRRLQKLSARYPEMLSINAFADSDQIAMPDGTDPDVIIDAVMGTGLNSTLRAPAIDAVNAINHSNAIVFAVDIPTGLDADTGIIHGAAVIADTTVTMAARKMGLLLEKGPECAGDVCVVDIGIPKDLILEAGKQHGYVQMMETSDLYARLPARSNSDHKYSVGMVGIVGASAGLTGAVAMSARAAYRSGAGAVVCAVPESVEPTVAGKLVETMTVALPDSHDGLTSEAVSIVNDKLSRARCILVGPGLGRLSGTAATVAEILSGHQGSVVIDADALHALAAHNHIKKPAKATWIMTPHSGEFARLSKNTGSIIEQCLEYARERQTILVLKGSPAVVTTPAGEAYLSPNTTRAMATAGTGDVLAGMIAGFLAQGMDPVDAALCALLGGELAARRYCTTRSFRSMVATDIIAQLPYVLRNESAD